MKKKMNVMLINKFSIDWTFPIFHMLNQENLLIIIKNRNKEVERDTFVMYSVFSDKNRGKSFPKNGGVP